MPDEDVVGDDTLKLGTDRNHGRCIGNHIVIDAGQLCDFRWNRPIGIDQRFKCIKRLAVTPDEQQRLQ